MDYIVTEIVVGIVDHSTTNDTIKRIPPLFVIILTFFIIRPSAMQEINQTEVEAKNTY